MGPGEGVGVPPVRAGQLPSLEEGDAHGVVARAGCVLRRIPRELGVRAAAARRRATVLTPSCPTRARAESGP
eukprot:scaffold229605_cov24-Tisochrysis_lutea.AAC.1